MPSTRTRKRNRRIGVRIAFSTQYAIGRQLSGSRFLTPVLTIGK